MLFKKANRFLSNIIEDKKPLAVAIHVGLFQLEPASCRCEPHALFWMVAIWMANKGKDLGEPLVQLFDSCARDPKDNGVSLSMVLCPHRILQH